MAKLPFSLGLATVIFTFILCTAQVNLDEVFTIQSGRTDGGCDRFYNQAAQTGVLDDWLSEISYSLDYALSAIEDYNGDIRVRRAMRTFFGIANTGRARDGTPRADTIAEITRTY